MSWEHQRVLSAMISLPLGRFYGINPMTGVLAWRATSCSGVIDKEGKEKEFH